MKKLITLCAIAIVAVACKPKADIKTIKEETMKLHDIVMAEHGKIIDNQMKIDTLLASLGKLKSKFPNIDTLAEKTEMAKIMADLVKAEEKMNDWMHKFDGDFKSEADTAVFNYYQKEHDKIAKVNELYQTEIKKSNTYLSKFNK
jgi:hypothetical protein